MKHRILSIICCLVTIGWMYGIYYLSTETGTETAETSQAIADVLAELFIDDPTISQVDFIHKSVRTLAHFALYSVLGVLATFSVVSFLLVSKLRTKVIAVSIVPFFVGAYGFYDEWQKQFIDGRHFDKSEAVLNIFSGLCGVLMAIILLLALAHIVYLIKSSVKKQLPN
ncbi:MAG: VanZ family protein [Clostridia bacterium]